MSCDVGTAATVCETLTCNLYASEPAPLSGTQVSSMVMVPLATEYSDSQMMEKDRMLMVVGSLVLPDSGNSTAALYDGQAWHPYLTSVGRDDNGAGASGLFYSIHDFSFHTRRESHDELPSGSRH